MKIPRRWLIVGILILAGILSVLWALAEHQEKGQRFHTVKKDLLYRSRQPDPLESRHLLQHHITLVVNLRPRSENQHEFDAEADVCRQAGVTMLNLPMTAALPSDEQLETFLRAMSANHGATLVHCAQGKSRTGIIIASYRVIIDDWQPKDALNEIIQHGDKSDAENLSEKHAFLQQLHRDRQAWLTKLRP